VQNIFKKIPVIAVLAALQFIGCSINSTTDYYYKITIRSAQGGTVCNAGDHLCKYNDTVSLTLCSVGEGYQFKEWVIDTGFGQFVIGDIYNDTTFITCVRGGGL
jgi:hypothetical protein